MMGRVALLAALALTGCAEPPGTLLPPEAPAYVHARELREDWTVRDDLPPCDRAWTRLQIRHVPDWHARGSAARWRGVPMILVRDVDPLEHVTRHEMAHLMARCGGTPDPDHELPEIWDQPGGVVWAFEEPIQWD